MPKTTQAAASAVEYHEPGELLTDKNVRLDPQVDAAFKASVKEHGVLQPVIALRTADGRIRVRMGHRRTLAAAAAKIQVPVIIIGEEQDGKAEDTARLLAQYEENTKRASLTTRETAGLVQDLLDLGMTDAQLRRKTGLSSGQVTAARRAVKSPKALAFADTWQLNLEQSAVAAEFDEDPEAGEALEAAAARGQFDHVAQQYRDSAGERAQKKQLAEELTAAGVKVLDQPFYGGRLDRWLSKDGEELTAENHAACPGHAAWLTSTRVRAATAATLGSGIGVTDPDELDEGDDYAEDLDEDLGEYGNAAESPAAEPEWCIVWVPAYVCTDAAGNGHKDRWRSSSATKPATEEEKEAASAERRKVLDGNKQWRAAEKVRRRWLKEFLTRTTPPDGALRIILPALAGEDVEFRSAMEHGHRLAAEMFGLKAHQYNGNRDDLAHMIGVAVDGRAQVIALGVVLAAYEASLSVHTWRYPSAKSTAARYLNHLAGWGYGLSEIEIKTTAAAPAKKKTS